MWTTIEKITETVKRIVENLCRQDLNLQQRLADKLKLRLSKYDAQSLKMCDPCPIPITIVSSKYDEFQNFDSEKRRNLCQFLRFLAYYYGANLMAYSAKMEQFPKIVKNMASHFAFGTVEPQGHMIDHNKPLFVARGTDSLEVRVGSWKDVRQFSSFQQIGVPPSSDSFMGVSSPFQLWRESFISLWPQKTGHIDNEENTKVDPMTDPLFKEPNIDNLVQIKRKVRYRLITIGMFVFRNSRTISARREIEKQQKREQRRGSRRSTCASD